MAERERLRNLEGCGSPPRAGSRRWRPTPARAARPRRSAGAAHALEAIRGVDAELDVLTDRMAALVGRGRRPRGRAAPLRRGRGRAAGPARRGRGAARAVRAAQAQARRHDRGGARPRRDLPRAARRARRRRGGGRGRRRRSWPRRAPSSTSARRSCARRARPRPRALADAVVGVLGELAMDGASFEARLSRAGRARPERRRRRRVHDRARTPASRPGRCATPRRAASSRA